MTCVESTTGGDIRFSIAVLSWTQNKTSETSNIKTLTNIMTTRLRILLQRGPFTKKSSDLKNFGWFRESFDLVRR